MQETMVQRNSTIQDLSTVAALQQKRTLAFVNHFAITTVQFLNNFVKRCEQKLMLFERKLEKVEAAMVLLEARLSSIPEVNAVKDVLRQDVVSEEKTVVRTVDGEASTEGVFRPEESEEAEVEEATPRPEYDRFVKMVQVGVPLQAVKLKVSIEGLDPNVFEGIMNK